MSNEIYISKDEIFKLGDLEVIRRINLLNKRVREAMNPAKTKDRKPFKSVTEIIQRWDDATNQLIFNLKERIKKSPFRNDPKKDEDTLKNLQTADRNLNLLKSDYAKFTKTMNDKGVQTDNDTDDPLLFKDDKPTGAGAGPDGDTYNVTSEAPKKQKIDEAEVDKAVQVAKKINGTDLSKQTNEELKKFINSKTYDQLLQEVKEIDEAIKLLAQADLDGVKTFTDSRNQEAMLDRIKKAIISSDSYINQRQKPYRDPEIDEEEEIDLDKPKTTQPPTTQAPKTTMRVEDGEPGPQPPLRNPPQPLQPEPQALPMGKVGDIPLSGSQLMSEAKTYIRQINKIPVFRLPPELLNIKEALNKAIKRIEGIKKVGANVSDESDLRDSVAKARAFFNRSDFNLNRVPDRKEVAGRAIDQGLDDMKKIEEQNKLAEQAKTKLTDLRPDAKEGENERIKKNFNKDVLELKTANDVLKSQVNLQREEIKVLKETIEQKKHKENEQMLAGVAPVFRHYLNLNIDNVVQEHEEKFYSTVI
jgi:hypothetical protein